MDRASSLIFPGSRTLAGWWRQLQAWQPQTVQVGYGFVHRVEALAHVHRSQPVDPFTHLILRAVSLSPADAHPSLDQLALRLGLPAAVLQQILLQMESRDLLARTATSSWRTTEHGRLALARQEYPVRLQQRCTLTFLERLNAVGERRGPPLYLPIAECAAAAWRVEDSHRFDTAFLQDCVEQSSDWKCRRAFPQEIEALVQNTGAPDWQRVIVDRPERMLLVLLSTGKAEWLGFAAKAEGWELLAQAPILRLSATEIDPDCAIVEKVQTLAWQEAWRAWCRQRNLPPPEVDSCVLTYQPPRLHVQAPERLVQRLRAAKSDLFKGEAWILVGDGYLRSAALLTLLPAIS